MSIWIYLIQNGDGRAGNNFQTFTGQDDRPNVTFFGKTDTNAFPLNGQEKRL